MLKGVFSTCPQSADENPRDYVERVIDIARASEDSGCEGILVYTDNRLVDPWLVAQLVLRETSRICPLVAVQPVYMHPYTVAKMVASYAFMFGRKVYLNLVAGGFKNDLEALDDNTPHDRRYDRLREYAMVIRGLVEESRAGGALAVDGDFYRTRGLRLTPPVPEELTPGLFVSGSSEAGRRAARSIGAVAIHYPKPAGEYDSMAPGACLDQGIRVGIIARPDGQEAWRAAHERFPENRKGQLTHQLAMKVSDSVGHRQLSELGAASPRVDPYWLGPFENYQSFCPYLVGSYEDVGKEIARYTGLGFATFIIDIPPDRQELEHTDLAFEYGRRLESR